MWTQRTSDEVAKWHEATKRAALSHGRLVAGMVLLIVPPLAAGGWIVSFRAGAAVQQSTSGSFWVRLPLFIIAALPIAWFIYRKETRSELLKLTQQTICRKCEAAGKDNEGASCTCGGSFVSMSKVRWVEESAEC
jgi:hypothetical protein